MNLDLSGLSAFKASGLLDAPVGRAGVPLEVELHLVDFDPEQPRRSVNDGALAELASSIKMQGVLQPVSLRRHPECPDRFIVNHGERRVRACRLAGLMVVPCFLDERFDPYAQVIENLQREDLTPFDLARFIAERERAGDSRASIARKLHKPASFISEVAGLIEAPAEVRSAFDAGRTRDTRVLYQLARGLREQPAVLEPLLRGDGSITRETLDKALAPPSPDWKGRARVGRSCAGNRLIGGALLVEHRGRRGKLRWGDQRGDEASEVEFEDGDRRVVRLTELQLVAWVRR